MKNDIVQIDNNKVYSSYYARACKILPSYRMVAISMKVPDNFKGEILKELVPSMKLVYGYKYNGMSIEEYTETYKFENLRELDVKEVYEKLKGKAIICYCGTGTFCHRHLVMEWLRQKLGDEVIGGEI